jgi:DNA-binding MarR family transcriptional regulator
LEPLPDDIRRFLDGNIETIDQLEVLRILGEKPDREWTAAELAAEVQAKPQVVATHVVALQGRGLLTAQQRGADLVARHGARTPELQTLVGRLLQLYRERPVTMIKMVYERAKDPLRTFADAFRLRKEEE